MDTVEVYSLSPGTTSAVRDLRVCTDFCAPLDNSTTAADRNGPAFLDPREPFLVFKAALLHLPYALLGTLAVTALSL